MNLEIMEKELAAISDADNVTSSPEVLEDYSRDLSFAPQVKPRCIVRPADTGEIQKLIRWANETQTPLVPVSSGPPRFRGDTIPGVEGAVIVDLSRMTRIIRIDPANRVAIVEPGVTFSQLQAALREQGLCAYLPLAPRRTKSVMGSVLEREPVTVPAHHWDAADPFLCAEVVFGTGDRFRTGEAAGPDELEGQWEIGKAQMSPFGPTQMDVHRLLSGAQGTIGIVTWISLKCRPLPKVSRAFFVPAEKLEPLVDLNYRLVRARMGEQLFILNGLNLACLLGRTPQEIGKLRESLPPWIMFVEFEGIGRLPEDKVNYQAADLADMAGDLGLKPAAEISGITAETLSRQLALSSEDPCWKLRLKGGCEDIFFLTTLDKTPSFAAAMSGLAQKCHHPAEDIGVYLQATVQGTSCHCEFNLYHDPAEPEAARKLVVLGADAFEKAGGFFSRPYQAWRDIAYQHAADTAAVQQGIKKIFDPKGILNPGKLWDKSVEDFS